MRIDAVCRGKIILLSICSWGLFCHSLFAQFPPQQYRCEAFSGTVLDQKMKPVAGATVWLAVDHLGEGARVVAKTTADTQGRFAFPQSRFALTIDLPETPIVLAEDASGSFGACRPWGFWTDTDNYLPPLNEIVVVLQKPKVFEGRLIDLQGKPHAGAILCPYLFSPYEVNVNGWEMTPLVPEIADEFSAKTDAEGHFVLPHATVAGSIRAKLKGDNEKTLLAFNVENPLTISLGQPGALQGKLTNAEDPAAVEGVCLCANVIEQDKSGKYSVNYTEQTTSAKDGSFHFEGIPPGNCIVNVVASGTQPCYNEPFSHAIKPGETVSEVTIPLKRIVALRGKVIDKETGEGIRDVAISVLCRGADNVFTRWQTLTDARGNYCCYVKPNSNSATIDLGFQLPLSAPEYLYSASGISRLMLTKDIECPAIKLERGIQVQGTVVDEQGQAVPHADVFVLNLGMRGTPQRLQSDEQGNFIVHRVPPEKSLYLRARNPNAASDPMTVIVPKDMTTPLKIMISEAKAAPLQMLCVDESGHPIAGVAADVSVGWDLKDHPILGSSIEPNAHWQRTAQLLTMGHWISDAEGRIPLTGLWAGDEILLQIHASDYDQRQVKITSLAGKSSEPTKVVLTSIRGVIQGTVLDSQGKPVADAKVFNRGDIPETHAGGGEISSKTDAAGMFRLDGFRSGPAYVFVEKEAYRFTALRTQTGAKDVVVKLLRLDEPIPARPQPKLPSLTEQQKLAHKILEQLLTDKTIDSETVLPMIRLDPAYVLKWSERKENEAQEGKNLQDTKQLARIFAAIKVANDDLDEGISLLQETDEWSALALTILANRFETSDPEKSLRCSEEAVVRARGIDQPMRTVVLAAAAACIARAGKKESGRKLAEEAAEMAEKLKGNKMESMATDAVAESFAAIDFDRAVRFSQTLGETTPSVKALSAVALEDLPKVEEILKQLEPEAASTVRLRLAYRLAPAHLQDALRIAEGIEPSSAGQKAEAFAWIASAVGKKEHALACSLIDKALSLCVDPPLSARTPANFRFGEDHFLLAAFIALHAQNIGYPDMESIVARVLAARGGDTSADDRASKRMILFSQLDPHAARQMMDTLRSSQTANSSGIDDQTSLLAAWIFLDPQVATRLIEQKLEVPSMKREQADLASLFLTADLLSISPDARLKYYSLRFLGSDLFEEEDYLAW